MKTLMVVLLVSGAAWAAASDERMPTKACVKYARGGMPNSLSFLDTFVTFNGIGEVRAASCAANPKLPPSVRLAWTKVLQNLIELRYDRDMETDMEKAIK